MPRSLDRGIIFKSLKILDNARWHGACDVSSDGVPGRFTAGPPGRNLETIMGIFDALNTAVGGLQAQSYALQNISGNIANASTTGYKGIGTTFEDLIPDSTTPN